MVALKSVKSVNCLSASLLTLGSAQTRLALLSLNRSLPWFLLFGDNPHARQCSKVFRHCSRLLGSLLKLPVAVVTAAAAVTPAAIRAAATGCLGFLGHDVGCNVLHFLSLLVQRTLGYAAFTKRSD